MLHTHMHLSTSSILVPFDLTVLTMAVVNELKSFGPEEDPA